MLKWHKITQQELTYPKAHKPWLFTRFYLQLKDKCCHAVKSLINFFTLKKGFSLSMNHSVTEIFFSSFQQFIRKMLKNRNHFPLVYSDEVVILKAILNQAMIFFILDSYNKSFFDIITYDSLVQKWFILW